tara:strand:+ start:278 stop:790 length:513 start_codon:yes stop_codon:yes gene_type:complete
MPLTPYHIVAGVAAKSIKPKQFSWTIFVLANISIDTEGVYYLITTGSAAHKIFHTWFAATIIAILCATFGKYLCEFGLRIWNNLILNEKYFPSFKRVRSSSEINQTTAWYSAFIGAYSHIILDSFVALDMKPYFPFSDTNHLLGLISLQNIQYLCLGLFFVGIMIYIFKK